MYSARPRALLQRPRAEDIRSQRAGGKGKKTKEGLAGREVNFVRAKRIENAKNIRERWKIANALSSTGCYEDMQ